MIDSDSVLEHLSRSKRRELFQFLREHDTDDARILLAGDPRELPKSGRTDRGTIALLFTGANLYNPKYQDFLVLVDAIDRDGREVFQKFYKRQEIVQDFLTGDEEQDTEYYRVPRMAAGRGRPKRELTGDEKRQIDELRLQGWGVNRIAAALHIGARRVTEHLRGGTGGETGEVQG